MEYCVVDPIDYGELDAEGNLILDEEGNPVEKHADPGDLVSDIPASSIPWLVLGGHIYDPTSVVPDTVAELTGEGAAAGAPDNGDLASTPDAPAGTPDAAMPADQQPAADNTPTDPPTGEPTA